MMVDPEIRRAAEVLAAAPRVVISTGAGMSKESGIPTFRDAQEGLWARFDPMELASERGFRSAPARVWSWYAYRRGIIRQCRPHAGHRALVELEHITPDLTIVTQNIDGMHQRAGSSDVIEIHGSIEAIRCIDCGREPEREGSGADWVPADEAEEREPPRCLHCGGYLRPGVVWFGESLPPGETRRAWSLVERCDVLLVVGTSGVVWPAAELPHLARGSGARVVEVTPEPTEVTPIADHVLHGAAGSVLPELVRVVEEIGRAAE